MQNNPLQIMQMLSQSQNPMQIITQMFGNTPQFQKVMQIAQGKSPAELKQYVQNICSTQGIDINSLAKQFNLPL